MTGATVPSPGRLPHPARGASLGSPPVTTLFGRRVLLRVEKGPSNPGETVLSPFAGIGSEIYMARKLGRKGIGCELKPSYWQTAVDNLTALDESLGMATLFDQDVSV